MNVINIHVDIKYACVVDQYTNRNIQGLLSNENDIEEHPIFFFSFDRKTISIVEGGVGLIAAGNNARGELIV